MNKQTSKKKLVRSNQLLFKKYSQYLIPTMITYAALSLNEFVDSMLVSKLLGSKAMAIVNLGMPLVMIMSATYLMIGSGGATIYAISLGNRDHDTAGESVTAAVSSGLIAGLALLALGMVFLSPLAHVLCSSPELYDNFEKYFRILLLSTPLEITILTFISFLPSAGYPGLSTILNVIANVVNILMDYVYIRIFHMGVEGAAWATLTGYICAAIVMVILIAAGRIEVYVSRNIIRSFSQLGEIIKIGKTDAANQLGLGMQTLAGNHLSIAAAGTGGMIAYALCQQAFSIMTIFIGAIMGASAPILAVLHGQKDYQGERGLLKTSMINQFFVSAAGTILFIVFASQVVAIYSITAPDQDVILSVRALRIFSLVFIPRYAVLIFYQYAKTIGLNRYSFILSALDSFALLVPIMWIMTSCIGIDGVWSAYPASSTLLVLITLLCNLIISRKSEGRLRGPLLYEYDESAEPVLDVTISKNPEDISGISLSLQQICEKNGLDKRKAMHAALAVEEIAVYASNKKRQSSHVDILVRLSQGNVVIDFRSLGELFNPLADDDSDIQENVRLLRGIASDIENEYLLGMNCTRITLGT